MHIRIIYYLLTAYFIIQNSISLWFACYVTNLNIQINFINGGIIQFNLVSNGNIEFNLVDEGFLTNDFKKSRLSVNYYSYYNHVCYPIRLTFSTNFIYFNY